VRGAWRWTVSTVGGQPRHLLMNQSPATHCRQTAPLCCWRHFASFRSTHGLTSLQTCPLLIRHLEVAELPALPSEAVHASPTNDVTAWSQVLGVTTEPASLTLDDIREAQSADDSLQPVI